ncbi:MAG: hypothetical protein LUD22_03315 [Coprobacillus sp.]|nr:hypothetical protein [Coprobacillus sp.]
MNVKKIRRNNLSRSFLIGVISVASVIGMTSVGFASWSFAASIEGDTVKVEADNIYVTTTDQALSNFGISVSNTSAKVEHYQYTVYEYDNVRDESGDVTYTEGTEDSDSVPVMDWQRITHDVYGDLNIHSDLAVSTNAGTASGLNSDNINTIAYDDPTYTYLKIEIELHGTFLRISEVDATLSLDALPQYVLSPNSLQTSSLPIKYSYYIPVKSTSKMSLYTMALTDTITSSSNAIPFNLDFTFDLSETYGDNTNQVNTIAMTYSIISEADYQTEISGGGR